MLRAIDEIWKVDYIDSQMPLQLIFRPHQEIAVIGKIHLVADCKKLLIHWIKNLAKIRLLHLLDTISQRIHLPYHKLTIRDQKTRWGSCTHEKNISLSYKILFLPEPLATHILIHELCHTVHLNHSGRFWKLVQKFDPDWQAHRVQIRKVNAFVPDWTDLSLGKSELTI